MTNRLGRNTLIVLVAATALVAVAAASSPAAGTVEAPAAQTNASNASDSVNVSVGAQLSTVIETRSQEVRMDVEKADFAFEFESGDPGEAVAGRAEELREAAADVREEYRDLAADYEDGEITREEFAQRIATLNDRAERIRASLEQLRSRADRLADEELADVRFNETEVRQIARNLEDVTGAGPDALLQRFTGQSFGEVELRLDNGLRIEVESEDGERSREIRRPGDDSLALTIGQDAALENARDALSDAPGNWTLSRATVHEDDGEYRFRFALESTTAEGETRIRVDGSAGEVVRVEEELEPREDDDSQLDLRIVDGTPAPGATITVEARIDGSPAANVPVEVEGDVVGRTDADGRITVTLPDADDARIRAETDDLRGELRFDFEDDDSATETPESTETPETETSEPTETPEPEMDMSVVEGTAAPNATITVQVTIDGSAAADVPVEVEGDVVGRTADDGTLTVTLPDEDDVRIRAETDDLRAERRFDFED